jgi:hypothetical protein
MREPGRLELQNKSVLIEAAVRVCITPGVKLRGPERSEGHVSFNIRVGQRSSALEPRFGIACDKLSQV